MAAVWGRVQLFDTEAAVRLSPKETLVDATWAAAYGQFLTLKEILPK